MATIWKACWARQPTGIGFFWRVRLWLGAAALLRSGASLRDLGGVGQFLLSFVTEIVVSVLYAPVLMVQQSIAVLRTAIGFREKWAPQSRKGGRYTVGTLLKFHALETIMGILLVGGMFYGIVSLWLLPIAASLFLALPLSALSGVNLGNRRWTARQMGTPEHLNAPAIIRSAMVERARFAAILLHMSQ